VSILCPAILAQSEWSLDNAGKQDDIAQSLFRTTKRWHYGAEKVVRQTILGLLLFPVVSLKAGFACFILLPYIQRWCPDLGLPKSPNAKTFSKPN
jgi:hypothetical protein